MKNIYLVSWHRLDGLYLLHGHNTHMHAEILQYVREIGLWERLWNSTDVAHSVLTNCTPQLLVLWAIAEASMFWRANNAVHRFTVQSRTSSCTLNGVKCSCTICEDEFLCSPSSPPGVVVMLLLPRRKRRLQPECYRRFFSIRILNSLWANSLLDDSNNIFKTFL